MLTNNMHNLCKVMRKRSEQGVFSDYPHYYKLVQERFKLSDESLVGKEPAEGEEKPYFGDLFA